MSIFVKKKLNNKVKISSDKTETEQSNLQYTRKDIVAVHNKPGLQLDKKE